MTEPVEPPSLDEIRHIVERRRRTRYRATQGVVGLAVAAAIGYGVTRPGEESAIGAPADTAATAVPTTGVADTSPVEPTTVVTPPPPADTVDGVHLLDPAAPPWLEAAGDAYAGGPAGTVAGFDAARAIAADWGLPVAETKAVLGVAADRGRELTVDSDDTLVSAFLARGGSFDEAAAIADDWRVSPLVVKMLAALDVSEVPLTLS